MLMFPRKEIMGIISGFFGQERYSYSGYFIVETESTHSVCQL